MQMSVEIETSALSMSESLNSLKLTPSPMHRIYFEVSSVDVWYKIVREANSMFGRNWRGQSRVKRKWNTPAWLGPLAHKVWFEVPDEKFGTWVAIKYAVTLVPPPGK
jgi:hypothetical protein